MRYRLMATYLGIPYHAGLGPDGTEVTLFSPGPPPTGLGFTAKAGHWRKQVSVTDLDALWQSRPVGDYRGDPCLVLDDFGDRLHIAYLGRDAARAAQLGYWEIDREVFEVVVARHDVTSLTELRVDFPLAAAMFPPPSSGPQVQAAAEASSVSDPTGRPPSAGPAAEGRGADHGSRAPDRVTAWHGSPAPEPWPDLPWTEREPRPDPPWTEREPRPDPPWTEREPRPDAWTEQEARSGPRTDVPPARRTGGKDRISPDSVFAELLSLSAIPQGSYAVDEEVPGAMCLVKADGGFEVFSRTDDARLEVCFFEDEEAAYFYLFGVLAAEAVRSGRLGPTGPNGANGAGNGSGAPGTSRAATGNVSKYLQGRKFPKSPSCPARVYLAGGADGPPLPKQPRRPPNRRFSDAS